MTPHTPDNCPLRDRVVRVEVENELAKPLHAQFRLDIEDLKTGVSDLKVGQAKMEGQLNTLLNNGRRSKRSQAVSTGGLVAVIVAASAAAVAVAEALGL